MPPNTAEPTEDVTGILGKDKPRFFLPPPMGYPKRDAGLASAFDSDSSTSATSTYDAAIDHTSGQDRAASISQALLDARGDDFMTLMTDPIAAVATGDRIRDLSRMIQAYKGGYDLPDLEVIPHTRMASEKFGSSVTKKSSSGSSSRGSMGINNF